MRETVGPVLEMKFDVYGRFLVEVQREDDAWVACKVGLGKRVRMNDVVPPPDPAEAELATLLDDVFHELSGPGQRVAPVA